MKLSKDELSVRIGEKMVKQSTIESHYQSNGLESVMGSTHISIPFEKPEIDASTY